MKCLDVLSRRRVSCQHAFTLVEGFATVRATPGKPGLPTCTTMTVSGSAAFIGTVYAPEAAFTFSGSSGASGSFTGNTVTINGGASVHYDEALGNAGQGYVVMSWNEF